MFFRKIDNVLDLIRFKIKRSKFKNISKNADIELPLSLNFYDKIDIMDDTYLGPGAVIDSRGGVEIGSGTIIGPDVRIYTSNHNYKDPEYLPYDFNWVNKKVIIGKNVWIGGNVVILPGAYIQDGSIIAAGSVVRGNVEYCSIISGNPAKCFGYRNIKNYQKLVTENLIYQIKKKNK